MIVMNIAAFGVISNTAPPQRAMETDAQ